MEEHVKIERLLYILKLLSSNVGYSYEELAERIDVTERTIRRYLKSIEKVGLFIENHNGYFRLEKNSPYYKEINSILHFSEEESVLLHKAINNIEATTLTKMNLRDKLFALYNSDRINYPIIKKEDSGNVKLIIEAIQAKKQIKLINYKSSNSGRIKDRIVEPYDFTTNYIHLWAYENEFSKNYLFRISRIEKVEVTNDTWLNEDKHKKGKTDVFRMSGEMETSVELKLTIKGYNYLVEQYPLSKAYVNIIGENEYIFNHWYANYQGISKYILSAIDDVEILKPDVLRDYMNNIIRNKKF
jgi:predicted DNA-binding transcriptional regulator YafY